MGLALDLTLWRSRAASARYPDLLSYNLVGLMTVGYGDARPVGEIARMLRRPAKQRRPISPGQPRRHVSRWGERPIQDGRPGVL